MAEPLTPKDHAMSTIADTSKFPPGDLLCGLIADGAGHIERMEAHGQRELCASSQLPRERSEETTKALTAWGVVFHGNGEDDLFERVTLPSGWSKQSTDHAMWSNLVDDKGRKRAAIFYKAAFYDRSAHMGVEWRYACGTDYTDGKFPIVSAEGVVVWRGENEPDYDRRHEVAAAKLAEMYPNHGDLLASWADE